MRLLSQFKNKNDMASSVVDRERYYSETVRSITPGLIEEHDDHLVIDKDTYVTCLVVGVPPSRTGRERFYAEIERYKQDNRFNQMLIVSECTYQEFLSFKPMFNGKSYNRTNHGVSVEAHRGTIAGLCAKGIPVVWAGTRLQATRLYEPLVRQWCRHNFNMVVKQYTIGETPDLSLTT